MGFETIPGTEIQYGLISYDKQGRERPEGNALVSDAIFRRAQEEGVTNVFFFCHGWKGDVPAAKDQYNRWIRAFAESPDRQLAPGKFGSFKPLYVGLHWPSQPWGDEEVGGGDSFDAVDDSPSAEALLETYVERLGDSPEIRESLQVLIEEARRNVAPDALSPRARDAYLKLNAALGLDGEGGGADAAPDTDGVAFDPDESFAETNEDGASFGGFSLGGVLGPLRQLSYWTMKKRARAIGEGGMHTFLNALQRATPARIHLMGHSFGTIVVSGMLGGPDARGPLVRPVDSVVLVQGAVSLWSWAGAIPFDGAGTGYFNRILADGKVRGPVVVTRSKHDAAVGTLYPLASRIKGSVNFADVGFPKWGAIGAFGMQGVGDTTGVDLKMLPATGAYAFEGGKVYNVESSQFIAKKEGLSGAHSDIAGPEVAHAIWAAALASA